MTHDPFVNAENAKFLQDLSEQDWQSLSERWGKDTPRNPVVFEDGSMYGDCGREVVRRMFWLIHKDDGSMCKKETHE